MKSLLAITLVLVGLTFSVVAFSTVAHAALTANVVIATSSNDAGAPLQTLVYNGTVTTAGTLTQITMSIPKGATVSNLRTSSGSIALYQPQAGYLIWVPKAPIAVKAGARLSIPVEGFSFGGAGTYSLGFRATASNHAVLSSGYGTLILTDKTTTCPSSWANNYIQTENAKQGTPGWQIPTSAYDGNLLSAFASRQSAGCGDDVFLKIDAPASWRLKLSVYRVGYYGGAGARKVWETAATSILGGDQAYPQILNGSIAAKPDNMASTAQWWYNVGFKIDGSFAPGTYLIKVDDGVGHQTFVPLTIRDDTGSKHDYLLQQATTTWQAYNTFGQRSFYTVPGSARLSFNRPYWDGQGSGQFLPLEYGLVYWMEQQGLDVTYWTDLDLDAFAASVPARTTTLILPAHDEYYSSAMRAGLQASIAAKVNVVSLGANLAYRQIIPDSPSRTFQVYERWTSWPLSTTWRYRGYAMNEQAITGAEYGCRSNGSVVSNSSWLWTGITPGTVLAGFANGETDWLHPVAQSPIPAGTTILTSAALDFCATPDTPVMDIVAYTAPSGAHVFNGSTFAYSCFLVANCPSSWQSKGLPLAVDPASATVVGQVVLNIFNWANNGLASPPVAATSGASNPSSGSLGVFQPQVIGSQIGPLGSLPSLPIEADTND